jgi:hypothetical protein
MCKQQSESLIGMRVVTAARLGQVGPLTSDGEADNQIVESCQDVTEGRDLGAPRIFMERDIATIVQAVLNARDST